MPIYEYACSACGHEFEEWQKMSDAPVRTCPKCKKKKVERLISRTAFQLKGSGWYADLYSSSKPGEGKDGKGEKEGKDGKDGKAAEAKSESGGSASASGGSSGESTAKASGDSGKSSGAGGKSSGKKKESSAKKAEPRAA